MFCLQCGKQIADGSKFCPFCGAVTSSGKPAGPAAPTPPTPFTSAAFSQAPVSGGGEKKGIGRWLLIGGAAAAVVVILAVVLLSGLFFSPKGQVEKAVGKTAAAYAAVGKELGMPDLGKLLENRSMSQRAGVELNSIGGDLLGYYYDLSVLDGLGVRVSADFDQKGRKMDCEMAAFWDGDDVASFQLLVDDAKVSVASPEFTKGDAYGINTETLGADLHRLGVDDSSINVKDISFNIFELIEAFMPSEEQTKEVNEAVKRANKALADATEVTKTGKESIQVNGGSVDATVYHVVVPKGAMKDYVSAMEDAMKLADNRDAIKKTLQSMGLPKDQVNEIMAEVKSADPYGQLADTLKQGIKELGDMEMDVCVGGGYVSAVTMDYKVDGNRVKIGLYLGGGENYVDDLSLEISGGGEKLTIKSTGSHSGKGGVFTDETTLRLGSDRVTSELRYEPKASNGNFEWELKLNNTGSLAMEGRLTAGKNSVDLKLDDVTVKAAGVRVCSLELEYYLGPCEKMQASLPSPKMLGGMDVDDLEDLYYDIGSNVEDWAYDMMGRLPSDLLWYFF